VIDTQVKALTEKRETLERLKKEPAAVATVPGPRSPVPATTSAHCGPPAN